MPDLPASIPDYTGVVRGMSRRAAAARDRTLAAFEEAADEPIARIRFWNQDIVLVNDEALIHAVLVEEAAAFRKGPLLTRNARPVLGSGLLTSDNDLNRRQRRILSPPFAHRKVADYAGLVGDYTLRQIDGWSATAPGGATIDAPQEMLAITLGVIGDMLFGDDVAEAAPVIGWALPVLMNYAIDQLRAPVRAVTSIPKTLRALIALNRTVNGQIRARHARGATDSDGQALLHLLLWGPDGQPPMSDRLARDEAMTLFLAGIETVALTVSWALQLLTRHPEAYARVCDEVDALPGDATIMDLPRLPFTLAVLKETLRLYPPAYIVARETLTDVKIGTHRLPAGTVVFACAYLRHRQAAIFPDPGQFDPDRWLDPEYERRLPRYAFMPFGGGAHVCIGGHFAMMEAHLMLALLARRATFTAISNAPDVVPEPLFTLRPRPTIRLNARRRSSAN